MFDLVVKRFLAVFGEPSILQNVNVTVDVNGNHFGFVAVRRLNEGWARFYQPYVVAKNDRLPSLVEGQKVKITRVTLNSNFTKPPPRYNPRSLLLKMEKEEIGTKATRAATIQTLQDRKYITGTNSLQVSDLGFTVINVLSQYCPIAVSPTMTKKLELEMEGIRKGTQTNASVLRDTLETLQLVIAEHK